MTIKKPKIKDLMIYYSRLRQSYNHTQSIQIISLITAWEYDEIYDMVQNKIENEEWRQMKNSKNKSMSK